MKAFEIMEAQIHRYDDGGPNLSLCLEAQQYYNRHKYVTRVKAAGLLNAIEAKRLCGVDSMTVAPDLLRLLSKTEEPKVDVMKSSIFEKQTKAMGQEIEVISFVDDEIRYREAFARSYDGKGAWKTKEVRLRSCYHVNYCTLLTWLLKAIDVFCAYQLKAENLLRDTEATATKE